MFFSYRSNRLPLNRELRSALQKIPGVGFWKSFFVCAKTGFCFPFFMIDLNFYFFLLLTFLFKALIRSTDKVRREKNIIFKNMSSLKTWRGLRHKDFLPVNGQRTRSNYGTRRREKKKILEAREARAKAEAEAAAKLQEEAQNFF